MAKQYKPEQRRHALEALAIGGGDITKTCAMLEAAGNAVPERTLRQWRDVNHADEYRQIVANRENVAIQWLAGASESNAFKSALVQSMLLDSVLRTDPKELDKATVNVRMMAGSKAGTIYGINVDKLLEFTGRPSRPRHPNDVEAIRRALAERFPGVFIEGEAEEIAPEALNRGPESAPNGNSDPS